MPANCDSSSVDLRSTISCTWFTLIASGMLDCLKRERSVMQ